MAGRLRVGVVGVGTIGRRHAENLAWRVPGARLVAVADARPEQARAVAEEMGGPRWFGTADELAGHAEVEAVVVASSDAAHREGIVAAARHGKDVLCEKPITPTLAEADEALAAVAEAGVRLQIGFMRRYDPAYAAAKARIEAGAIGTPVLIKATHRNPAPPPSSGAPAAVGSNVFVGAAVHDYDNGRWLLGDEVVEVHAVGAPVEEPARADDLSLTTLRFARGGLGSVEVATTRGYGYDVRAEIVGTTGTLFVGDVRRTACVLATADGVVHDAFDHWLTRFGEAYRIEVEDWVRRTVAGEPPFVTGLDGRAALEIAVAATRSAGEGRAVSLPLR